MRREESPEQGLDRALSKIPEHAVKDGQTGQIGDRPNSPHRSTGERHPRLWRQSAREQQGTCECRCHPPQWPRTALEESGRYGPVGAQSHQHDD